MSEFNNDFNLDDVKKVLEAGTVRAKEVIEDPSKIDALLEDIEIKLKEIPTAGDVLSKAPLMIAMIKAYITKEYTEISPKVVISLISALLYLLKKKDIIPDNIPLIGHLDDLAFLAAVLMLNEPELKAFAEWRQAKKEAPVKEAPVQEEPAQEAPVQETPAQEEN